MAKRLKPPNFTIINSSKTKSSVRGFHLIDSLLLIFLPKFLLFEENLRRLAQITAVSLLMQKKASLLHLSSHYL